MPPPPGPASGQFLKVAAVPSKSGRNPASESGMTIGSGPGARFCSSRSAGAAPRAAPVSIGFGEPNGRKQRRTGDIAVGRVVDAAEVVGHGIGYVITHAHRPGVMMRRAEIVAAILERGRARRVAGRRGAGGHWNDAVGAGEDVERFVSREDQGDLVGNRIHRVPGRHDRFASAGCRETAPGYAFALPR